MEFFGFRAAKVGWKVSEMPDNSPMTKFLTHVTETAKCGRLYNFFVRWFGEKRKKGISFT